MIIASFDASSTVQKDDVLTALAGRYLDFYQAQTPLKRMGGEWRGPCPLHQGHGPSFAVNAETGGWFCHSQCQTGGDILTFVQAHQRLDFPAALDHLAAWAGLPASVPAAKPVKFLDPCLAEQAHAALMDHAEMRRWLLEHRGFTPETLQRFQIGLLPPDKPGSSPRVSFPVYNEAGKLTNIRKHLFALTDDLDRTYKTLPWKPGLRSDLFPLSSLSGAGDVLLVEGEADAVLANQLGFHAVTGTLGAGTWKDDWTLALSGHRVTILYDSDKAGQDGAQKAARALTATGCPVRLASLPEGVGKDLTEWIVGHGGTAEVVQAALDAAAPFAAPLLPAETPLLTEARPPPARKPIADRIIDLADVEPPGELPLLFGQYLLHGHTHWLTGQTGLGKSTLLFNIACTLAEGQPLWGYDCNPTRVLYCDMESGDIGRAHKIDRLYGSRPRVRGQLFFLREPVKLPEEMPELLAFVQAEGIQLVIFDTARRCFTVRDENDNAEVYNRVVPTLDALKQLGVASLTLGHPSKNGNGSARGAGAQEDAGDCNLSLTMHGGEVNDKNGVICLRVTKSRLLGLSVPPLYLRRIGDDQFKRVETGEAQSMMDEEKPKNAQERADAAILDYLKEQSETPPRHKEILQELVSQGIKVGTAKPRITALQKMGKIAHDLKRGYVLVDSSPQVQNGSICFTSDEPEMELH
jgi:5S rRNA maturation endonuclease (ribonuclease M5)